MHLLPSTQQSRYASFHHSLSPLDIQKSFKIYGIVIVAELDVNGTTADWRMAPPSTAMAHVMAEDRSPNIVVGSIIVGVAATLSVVLRLISHRIIRSPYDWSDLLIVVGLASTPDYCGDLCN